MVSDVPFRFVHAAGLRLDDVCTGIDELPGELLNLVIDARFRAAVRLFETAIRERAACIVIVGELFTRGAGAQAGSVSDGPVNATGGRVGSFRAATFLMEQCQRLAEQNITVYWSEAGESPVRQWPSALPMPVNLVPIDSRNESRMVTSQGATVLIRQSSTAASNLQWGATGGGVSSAFRILVVPTATLPTAVSLPASDNGLSRGYVAFGGSQGPLRITTNTGTAVASGTTQGDNPRETGMRGCVVVDVRPEQALSIRFQETASVHWHFEQTGVDDATGWDSLRAYLHAQSAALTDESAADMVLMRWVVSGHGEIFERLMQPEVRSVLRAETLRVMGEANIPVYCLGLEAVPDHVQHMRWRNGVESGSFAKVLDELTERDRTTVDLREFLAAAGLEIDAATSEIPVPHFDLKIQPVALQRGIRAIADRKR